MSINTTYNTVHILHRHYNNDVDIHRTINHKVITDQEIHKTKQIEQEQDKISYNKIDVYV